MQIDIDEVKTLKQQLIAAGVEFCFATYVDVHGIPKAKAVPIDCFEKMCRGSELFTVGAMDGLGLIGPHEDECAAVPDLKTCMIFPWDNRYAWFASDLYYHGEPYPACSRVMLKQVLQKATQRNYVFNLGIEAEFYVLRTGPGGEYQPFNQLDFKSTCPAYDLHLTVESMPFLGKLSHYMNQLGWGVYSFDQEGGLGQCEFDFAYADALTMADRLIFLRYMAKTLAQSLGAVATFMPKPFANDFRSAAHFNMSLADASTGKNLFEPQPDQPASYDLDCAPLTLNFVAGLLSHAPALAALTCPTFNSYKGLLAQGAMQDISWAPILQTYGRNNRSAMLRLPMNRYCIENRAPDMSCNPYLAAAFSLAAGLEGIDQQRDPGPPLAGNLYDVKLDVFNPNSPLQRLPMTLLDSLKAFAADPLVTSIFGDDFRQIYLNQKLKEWERAFYQVYEEERQQMLTFV
jgi:glutamine synthetase